MDDIKNIITGTILTVVVGGTIFTFSQQDVVNNLAEDTGLTQEQAEQYVNQIPEDELGTWEEIGSELTNEGQETLIMVNDIDCVNYEYEWESALVSCSEGKAQLLKIANAEKLLGQSFLKLSSENATEDDMRATIKHLDQLNVEYQNEISTSIFGSTAIDEVVMTNSYNKSLLKTALESE